MTTLDLLHEIADVPPAPGTRHAAVASAADKLGVDLTTAYRWARNGLGGAKFSHVVALLTLANECRARAGRPAVTVAEFVGLVQS